MVRDEPELNVVFAAVFVVAAKRSRVTHNAFRREQLLLVEHVVFADIAFGRWHLGIIGPQSQTPHVRVFFVVHQVGEHDGLDDRPQRFHRLRRRRRERLDQPVSRAQRVHQVLDVQHPLQPAVVVHHQVQFAYPFRHLPPVPVVCANRKKPSV